MAGDVVYYVKYSTRECKESREISMDNTTLFKSVAFGGFDKQDVIAYIQRTAQEAAEAQEKLCQENDALRSENESLSSQLATLRYQMETLRNERRELEESLAKETALREKLESLGPQAEALRKEAEILRPQAEAYVRFQGQIGAIECQARERAANLEDETKRRLRETAEAFQVQYQALMQVFETAAAHVNSELRKVEVNLTQLPRTLDRSGAELQKLMDLLEDGPRGEEA